MKKYATPIALLLLLVLGAYYLYDEGQRSYIKARAAYDSLKSQLDSARRERDEASDKIVSLNKSVKASADFLTKWKTYYQVNKDYEGIIGKVAEKTHCVIIERKWESKHANVGKLDYPVDAFSGTVVGDYKDLVDFVGQIETMNQLSTIVSMEFKEGLSGVTCSLNVWMPQFNLTAGGGAP
jgi:hypothetical protein